MTPARRPFLDTLFVVAPTACGALSADLDCKTAARGDALRGEGVRAVKVWQLLRSLESLSDTMASLYDCLRLHCALDVDASDLFAGIRDEKLARRDLVRHERQRLFQTLENYLEVGDDDQGALDRTLRAVEDLMARAGRLSLEEAVRSALALEREATARHPLSAVGRATPFLGALARNLAAVEPNHAARLASFAGRRGIRLGP